MNKVLRKRISNGVFFIFVLLLLIPFTRTQVQIFLTRYISFSPGVIDKESRETLDTYEWSLQGITAQNLDFTTAKNKVVLVNFWATWCPPCVAELPSMQKLYDRYKNKVAFVFVSNEQDSILHKFMKTNEYDFPVYRAISNTPPALYGKSLPLTYVLDKKGDIVIRKEGAADWDTSEMNQTMEKLLAE